MTLAIFAADLHGNRFAFEKLFALAIERGIDHVILGGDLTPKWPIIHFNKTLVPCLPKNFRFDDNGETLVDYLEEIEPAIKNRKTEAERYFVKLGGYQVHAGVSKDWQRLLDEQKILRKLTSGGSATASNPPILSAKEWNLIEALIKENYPVNSPEIKDNLRTGRYLTMTDEQKQEAFMLLHEIAKLIKKTGSECAQWLQYHGMEPEKFTLPQTGLHKFLSYCFAAAKNHPLNLQIRETSAPGNITENAQMRFLKNWLAKQIKSYKTQRPGARVYLILGNDDMAVCAPVARQMHQEGLIVLLHDSRHELADGIQIAGYPYVRNSGGQFYDAWEKPESEIYRDLIELDRSVNPQNTVYVIHTPPAFCALDASFENRHFGSQGMRQWLEAGPKHIVLSGHIHEAPFINGGVWKETVNGTLCMQPGGWHDENLCAVIFDITHPEQSEWIVHPNLLK